MVWLDPSWSEARKLEEIERWPVCTGFGDDLLRIDGLKLLCDGGVEGAALEEPHAGKPDFSGHLLIDPDELTRVVAAGVDRGWRVGCHAAGDRTLRVVLDAFEAVLRGRPQLSPGTLSVEHAMLAPARERARAIQLGVAVHVQYPLLWQLAANVRRHWGDKRANAVFPLRSWVEEGALVAAGSDTFVAPWDPLLAVWGMVTRRTAMAGVLGPEQALDRHTAFDLYTRRAAIVTGGAADRGSVAPGHLADLVAFRGDPLTCSVDDLPELAPVLTLLGGEPVWDPEGRVAR
jgi:predicted amidohydrolase YtcJ